MTRIFLAIVLATVGLAPWVSKVAFAVHHDDESDGDEHDTGGHRTVRKLMIEKTFSDACLPLVDLDINRTSTPLPALGTITAGPCLNAWSSGVNFAEGWESIRKGKHGNKCNAMLNIWTTAGLRKGRLGDIDRLDCDKDNDNIQDSCLHTDGKIYYQCNGTTSP
jgi:hypothetical protein